MGFNVCYHFPSDSFVFNLRLMLVGTSIFGGVVPADAHGRVGQIGVGFHVHVVAGVAGHPRAGEDDVIEQAGVAHASVVGFLDFLKFSVQLLGHF